jgi:hypothetical protein
LNVFDLKNVVSLEKQLVLLEYINLLFSSEGPEFQLSLSLQKVSGIPTCLFFRLYFVIFSHFKLLNYLRHCGKINFCIDVLCFSATFNNISAISRRTVYVLEEAGVSGENYRPWTSNWYIWSLAAVSWVHLSWNIQNGARTQGVLVIGLYELLDPTTYLIESHWPLGKIYFFVTLALVMHIHYLLC